MLGCRGDLRCEYFFDCQPISVREIFNQKRLKKLSALTSEWIHHFVPEKAPSPKTTVLRDIEGSSEANDVIGDARKDKNDGIQLEYCEDNKFN